MEQIKHRVLGLRAVAAVALASLIIGGGAGAALGALGDGADDGGGRGPQQMRFVPNNQNQDPSQQDPSQQDPSQQDPNGLVPGQPPGGGLPPGTAPDDDVQPDSGSGSGSGSGSSDT